MSRRTFAKGDAVVVSGPALSMSHQGPATVLWASRAGDRYEVRLDDEQASPRTFYAFAEEVHAP